MNTLERVIGEQQAELDLMKTVIASQLTSIRTVYTRNTELFEKLGEFLDAKIPDKTDEDTWRRYTKLKRECEVLVAEAGFCQRCRNFVCECEHE